MRLLSFALAGLLLLPATALGWGFDGHRRLTSHLHDVLPAGCLRSWISANQSYTFQNMSCDPDRWRVQGSALYDPQEAPRHYLEVDWVSPITDYPRDWAAAQAQLGQYAYRNGYVPWRIEEKYQALVQAFQSKNTATILATLAHLSHYVTDAFSILHDTKNFDPGGLHLRWESELLNTASYLDGITTRAASYYGTPGRAQPRMQTFDIVIIGNGLVAELIAADQAATPADGGAYNMAGFYAAVRDLTARRWGDALTLLASLVGSAWVDAGRPLLTNMPAGCSTTIPQGEVVLKGYPRPGGWTVADAGLPDAGGGGGGGEVIEPFPEEPLPGCGCTQTWAAGWPLLVSILWLARRRARS